MTRNHRFIQQVEWQNQILGLFLFYPFGESHHQRRYDFRRSTFLPQTPRKIPVADTSVEEKLFVSEPTLQKNDFDSLLWVATRKNFGENTRYQILSRQTKEWLSQIKDVRVDLQEGSCLRLYTKLVHRGLLASQGTKKTHRSDPIFLLLVDW